MDTKTRAPKGAKSLAVKICDLLSELKPEQRSAVFAAASKVVRQVISDDVKASRAAAKAATAKKTTHTKKLTRKAAAKPTRAAKAVKPAKGPKAAKAAKKTAKVVRATRRQSVRSTTVHEHGLSETPATITPTTDQTIGVFN